MRRRLLFIEHAHALGGAMVALLATIAALDTRRYAITVALARPSAPVRAAYAAAGVTTVDWPGIGVFTHLRGVPRPLHSPRAMLAVARELHAWHHAEARTCALIAAHRPHLVHLNSAVLAPTARALMRLGIPTVWHVREHPGREALPWRTAALSRLMRRSGHSMIFLSHADRDAWGLADVGTVVHDFVDGTFFSLAGAYGSGSDSGSDIDSDSDSGSDSDSDSGSDSDSNVDGDGDGDGDGCTFGVSCAYGGHANDRCVDGHRAAGHRADSLRVDGLRVDGLRTDSLRVDGLRADSHSADSHRVDSHRADSLRVDKLRAAGRRAHAIAEGVPVIAYLGGLTQLKGIHPMLAALAELRRELPQLRALMPGAQPPPPRGLALRLARAVLPLCGTGTHVQRAERTIAQRRLQDVICRVPFRADVRDVIAAADVLAFPATEPHFARPLIEAAALRVPVVASDLPGPREIVVHGVTGFLVPAGAPAPLARRLAQLLADAPLRRAFGDAAAVRARRLFAAPAAAADIEEIYGRVLGTDA